MAAAFIEYIIHKMIEGPLSADDAASIIQQIADRSGNHADIEAPSNIEYLNKNTNNKGYTECASIAAGTSLFSLAFYIFCDYEVCVAIVKLLGDKFAQHKALWGYATIRVLAEQPVVSNTRYFPTQKGALERKNSIERIILYIIETVPAGFGNLESICESNLFNHLSNGCKMEFLNILGRRSDAKDMLNQYHKYILMAAVDRMIHHSKTCLMDVVKCLTMHQFEIPIIPQISWMCFEAIAFLIASSPDNAKKIYACLQTLPRHPSIMCMAGRKSTKFIGSCYKWLEAAEVLMKSWDDKNGAVAFGCLPVQVRNSVEIMCAEFIYNDELQLPNYWVSMEIIENIIYRCIASALLEKYCGFTSEQISDCFEIFPSDDTNKFLN